ncbi:hypothetical protein RBWH47_05639 [Rhodopirellula baltica WH47]|uniref:Uncharacterized protein n=1 Tax=Rhodopirellula baltica WH47 TaxID=991778 RepID=F2ATL0_RHOBT|nr:hypothetical protein RBWH47_05639 [Rhodopirellula baltica WH47]
MTHQRVAAFCSRCLGKKWGEMEDVGERGKHSCSDFIERTRLREEL